MTLMTSSDIRIAPPDGDADLDAVRALFTEYAQSLGFSLAYQGFDEELAGLPGKYAPPEGALLLARAVGKAAGVVALRAQAPGICEMKRLYVRPHCRALRTAAGLSIGRTLTVGVIDEARRLGYGRLRLDTVVDRMGAAVKLYRTIGFVDIPPYYESPVPNTAYMELAL